MAVARREIRQLLTSFGYDVSELPFRCGPGKLEALRRAGTGVTLLTLLVTPLLFIGAPAWAALAVLLAGSLVTGVVALRTGFSDPAPDREDANLVAVRPGVTPRAWLVAHLDTKAQRQSMAGRIVAIWVGVIALIVALVAAIGRLDGPLESATAMATGAMLLVAGGLLNRGRLDGETAGTCDNASGIVALLTAAHASRDALGFIVTSAEEFGMLGARALARDLPGLFRNAPIVNLDTLDDRGRLYVVRHDARSAPLERQVLALLDGVAPAVRSRRLPVGILVDSLPLSRVAPQAVTIGRLDWATLRRMHTVRDAPATCLFGTAIAVGSRLATGFDPIPSPE